MEHVSRVIARPKRVAEKRIRIVHRKLPLDLYELEPDSGVDRPLNLDLNLDQIKD